MRSPPACQTETPPSVVSPPWRGKRLTREVVEQHYPPKADDGNPGSAHNQAYSRFSTLWYDLFINRIGMDAEYMREELSRMAQLAAESDDLPLQNDIARASVFAECMLLGLKTSADLSEHSRSIDDLHAAVTTLLQDPRLERDPIGVCLIVIQFGEAIIPYVGLRLATLRDTLPEGLRQLLLTRLREANTLFLEHRHRSSQAFVLTGGEIVHTRYFGTRHNLLTEIGRVTGWY